MKLRLSLSSSTSAQAQASKLTCLGNQTSLEGKWRKIPLWGSQRALAATVKSSWHSPRPCPSSPWKRTCEPGDSHGESDRVASRPGTTARRRRRAARHGSAGHRRRSGGSGWRHVTGLRARRGGRAAGRGGEPPGERAGTGTGPRAGAAAGAVAAALLGVPALQAAAEVRARGLRASGGPEGKASSLTPPLFFVFFFPVFLFFARLPRYEESTNELINEELGIAYPVIDGIPNMIPEAARKTRKRPPAEDSEQP